MYFWPKVFLLVMLVILPVEQNKDPTPYTLLTLFNEEGGDVWTPTHVENFPTLLFGLPKLCVFKIPSFRRNNVTWNSEEVVAAAATAAGWHVVSVYLQNSFLTLGRLFLDLRIPGRARNWVVSPQTPTRF